MLESTFKKCDGWVNRHLTGENENNTDLKTYCKSTRKIHYS